MTTVAKPERPKAHWGIRLLCWLGEMLPALGGYVAFASMVCLFCLAFCFVGQAICDAFRSQPRDPQVTIPSAAHPAAPLTSVTVSSLPQITKSSRITVQVLHGVELMFLAPLPFLVFLSLARYVKGFLPHDDKNNSQLALSGCGSELHSVKTLVVALMTASVATDLLRRAIEDVTLSTALAEGLIMLLLGSYWFALERVCRSECPSRTENSTPPGR